MFETFSRRQKRQNQTAPDVFVYDKLPKGFRVQAVVIWADAIKAIFAPMNVPAGFYDGFHSFVATELGVFELETYTGNSFNAIAAYFTGTTVQEALDILEMMFVGLVRVGRDRNDISTSYDPEVVISESITDLNARLLQHGIGYSLVDGAPPQIIRKDSEHLHNEVVRPALELLAEQGFEGANDEYRKAHEHYRHGRQKECLNDCLKAFESTMKTICARRKWPHQQNDTAKTLIDICLRNGLLPSSMQNHLGSIRSALESGIPTVRNKMGGHGQGEKPAKVPDYFAEYLLHETATTIVFPVSAFKCL
jgi:AbiJ N-terminal domain 4